MEEGSPRETPAQYRLSATLIARNRAAALEAVSELGLDRVADMEGQIRLLLWPHELAPLLERGFELRLHRAIPVRPLDKKRIFSDEEAKATVERRLRGLLKGGA